MTAMPILFTLVAALTLGAALLVVTTRNLVHAALWLVLALFGVAVFFVLLSAGFLAVAQVVIYIGAIAVLMIFAIMLTRRIARDAGPQVNPNWGWALLITALFFGGLVWMVFQWPGALATQPELNPALDTVQELGKALVSPGAYLIPFEVASVLLLAALIGAIMIAWERK
ncbi:MAG: NADH-quinone oxidoreductase subunit J [Anaerolineales bacterium]|nr:NADH-quinone oxidoreductase subunit J [Anaerolineales bacterium]